MLHLCSNLSLYGFGLYHQNERITPIREFWFHYFDGVGGGKKMDDNFSFDVERLLMQVRASSGLKSRLWGLGTGLRGLKQPDRRPGTR